MSLYRQGSDAKQAALAGYLERPGHSSREIDIVQAAVRGLDGCLTDGRLELPDTPPGSPVAGQGAPIPSPETLRRQAALSRDDQRLIDAFVNATDPAPPVAQQQALARLATWQREQLQPDGSLCYPDGLRALVQGDDASARRVIMAFMQQTRTIDTNVNTALEALRERFPVSLDVVRRLNDRTLMDAYRRREAGRANVDRRVAMLKGMANWLLPRGGLVESLRQGPQAIEDVLNEYGDFLAQGLTANSRKATVGLMKGTVRDISVALANGQLQWPAGRAVRLPRDGEAAPTNAAPPAPVSGQSRKAVAADDELIVAAFRNQRAKRSEQWHQRLTTSLAAVATWMRQQRGADGSPSFPDGLRGVVTADEPTVGRLIGAYGRSPRSNANVARIALDTLRGAFSIDPAGIGGGLPLPPRIDPSAIDGADAPPPTEPDKALKVLNQLAGRRFSEFENLWRAFSACTGEPIEKRAFLRHLYELTSRPDAVKACTGVHGLTHYTLVLHGDMVPVHLLRRDDADGGLRDLQLVGGAEGDVSKAKDVVMQRAVRSAYLHGSRSQDPDQQERLRALWGFRRDAFEDVLETVRRHPEHAYLSGPGLLRALHEWADAAPRRPTRIPDMHEVTVRLPQVGERSARVDILRRVGADGELLDIHRVPDSAKDREELLAWVESAAAEGPSDTHPRIAGVRSTPNTRLGEAARLRRALETMVGNRDRGKPLFEGVAEAADLAESTLREWLNPDGSLRGSEISLGNVKGYGANRQDLDALFRRLNQHESADRLPGAVTCAGLVRALRQRRDDPQASPATLARAAGIPLKTAINAIDMDSGHLLVGNRRLSRLPDYPAHRDTLRAVLQQMGQAERAADLPAPATAAERFLFDVQDQTFSVVAAVRAMRGDPGLSAHRAAELAGGGDSLPSILTALAKPGGELRTAEAIAQRVPDFEAPLRPELDRLMRQVRELLQSATSGTGHGPASSGMRAVLLPNRGIMGADKVFVVNENDTRTAGPPRRLAEIYAASAHLVRPPRVYGEDERVKQCLRWLSTALKRRFPRGMEVQAYWDAGARQVWVSSNSTPVNRQIDALLASGGLTGMLSDLRQSELSERDGRHVSRLDEALRLSAMHQASPMREVLKAMVEGRFRVPLKPHYHDGSIVDLHAERRIQDALGSRLDTRVLGGVRRPCMTCGTALGQPEGMRSGPAWLSEAGKAGMDVATVVSENVRGRVGSYITRGRDNKLTLSHDTDSEDEPD